MNIIEKGTRKPYYSWMGRYQCPHCGSVLELTADDKDAVKKWEEDQREGMSVLIVCPVCERERWISECNAVVGRCGGRGTHDKP